MRLQRRNLAWLAPLFLATAVFSPAVAQNASTTYEFEWGWREIGNPTTIVLSDKNLVQPYHVFPDGQISTIRLANGNWISFWANAENYRSEGPSPLLEDQWFLNPPTPYPEIYYGGRIDAPVHYNGGRWLLSVHPHPTNGNPNHLVAFVHAEDAYWPRHVPGGPAWKSIMVSHSLDAGFTWEDKGEIITSFKPRPSDKDSWNATLLRYTSGGVGNHAVIWDKPRKRWVLIFEENWCGLAMSTDPDGMPGTWTKWNGPEKGYVTPGIGGGWVRIPAFANFTGTNPTITYNTYLERYIIAYGLWMSKGANMAITATKDFESFEPMRLFFKSLDESRAWYPTFIDNETGSYESSQLVHMYYADYFKVPVNDTRQMVKRDIELCLGKDCGAPHSYIISPASAGRGNTTTNIVNDIPPAPANDVQPAPANDIPPAPANDKPPPDNDIPAPDNDKPAPDNDKPAPDNDIPAPANDKPPPDNNVPALSAAAPIYLEPVVWALQFLALFSSIALLL